MKQKPSNIVIPPAMKPQPRPHEIEMASILAAHFHCQLTFIAASNGYKMKSPDIDMDGLQWELKSPSGSSKRHTIKDQLKRAKTQSRNIVIDTVRTSLSDDFVQQELLRCLKEGDVRVRRRVMIDKNRGIRLLKM